MGGKYVSANIYRKTGWTNKPNFKRDSDGLANIDDFFDSEPEIQEHSSEEEAEENIPQDMIPASRRHRMNREERRQERFRHRGRTGRERVPSEEIEQELYEEEDQNDHPQGFFDEDQVNGFLPTRPLARTPLAPRNFSQEPLAEDRTVDDNYQVDYRVISPTRSRRGDVYDNNESRGADARNRGRGEEEYKMERPLSRAYSVQRAYSVTRSPRMVHDDYLSDHSKYGAVRSPLQQSRRESNMYNRGYQNSPKMLQVRNSHYRDSPSHTNGGHAYSPRVNRPNLKYPESSNDYERRQVYSPRVNKANIQYPESYEAERYPNAGNGLSRRQSYYEEDHANYGPHHYPGSDRKLRKSLSYPELPRVRPLSRSELASNTAIGSRPQSRVSVHKSPRMLPQSPPDEYEYNDFNDNYHGTPVNHKISETSYENDIARSLSMGKSRISSARTQKVSVDDVHEKFEGEDYNDFPDHIEDHPDDHFQPEHEVLRAIEEQKNTTKAKRGRPKKSKVFICLLTVDRKKI